MNKLNEMNIADLKDTEISSLMDFEKNLNQMRKGDEVYVLVLKK